MEPNQPASPSPGSSVGLLAHFHKIPMEVDQPGLGLHIFRNFTVEKINMAPVNAKNWTNHLCK